jgi:hypothetical protein
MTALQVNKHVDITSEIESGLAGSDDKPKEAFAKAEP